MISVSNLGMHFGEQVLFADVTFQLNPGNRYGLVGANGSGKSTLIKILMGQVSAETGEVSLPNSLKVGVLQQDHFAYEKHAILDVVLQGKQGLWDAMVEKEKILEYSEITDEMGHRLGDLETTIADYDGYQAEADAGEMLIGLGILEKQLRDPLSSLSGGYKLRVLLAQCLFGDPDFLLLDEPTNHLDLDSIHWLEGYLKQFKGSSLVISHDQHFLNSICTHILDIDYETIKTYPGNYQKFLEAKELERSQKEADIVRQEKKKEDLQQFIDRFKAKASKARQAGSRAKQLDKMEDIAIKRSSRIAPNFIFALERPSGKTPLTVRNISKSFGEKKVIQNLSLELERGKKIAVIGPNGVGKSTLLKILMEELNPTEGEFEWGHEVSVGYFSQDHHDLIQKGTTAYEWLYSFSPSETIGTIRSLLARVLFSGDDVHKASSTLSGGESGRLIFSKLMLQKPNFLLLDEPTNHMDLETIDALGKTLANYEGTVICVSHDRNFIEAFATDILELKHGGFEFFHGSYPEYLEKQGKDYLDRTGKLKDSQPKAAPVKKKNLLSNQDRRKNKKEQNRLERNIKTQESKISEFEEKIAHVEKLLLDGSLYEASNKIKLGQTIADKQTLEGKLEHSMEAWETAQEQLEKFQAVNS
ncbi:MAG: ABC-F family ATPase [SAR324 cluster bacterium]|uniref:ABC-F family ATPase n=1 Tax=SAR324 cluster bacterium TaxID=2024889 RepID=A0A2A4T892_9DELT|nr:MAG: ABC-F family ATPase [SAR324 cluster bacterium]